MPTSERSKRRARLARAALGVAFAWVVWGCLNPRPDDDPSVAIDEFVDPPSGEEACDTNPLFQDCDDSGGNQLNPDNTGNTGVESGPNDEDDDAEEPSRDDPDPNVDVSTADAGAPDARAPDASPDAN